MAYTPHTQEVGASQIACRQDVLLSAERKKCVSHRTYAVEGIDMGFSCALRSPRRSTTVTAVMFAASFSGPEG